MSIRPIDLNGMIQNTNEVSQVKAREDARPELQQQNLNVQMERQSVEDASRVKEQENVAKDSLNAEEGDGRGYGGNGEETEEERKREIFRRFCKEVEQISVF